MSDEESRDFLEFQNCPGCRRACPADQLTCDVGKGIFAEMKAKKEKQQENQPIRPYFPDTLERLEAAKKQKSEPK